MKKIVIIGAGASGVLCSIYLKRWITDIEVCILEANQSPLKKLLATGNGRCNLSNKDMNIHHYYGEEIKKIEKLLDYDIEDEFFQLGILTKYNNNLLYPRSEQALTVKNCLYQLSLSLGVKYFFEQEVIKIDYQNKYVMTKNAAYQFDDCILAFGSPAGGLSLKTFDRYQMLEDLNLKINPLRSALVQMKTKPSFPKLKGVRVKGTFSIYDGRELIKQEKGELLFTQDGVSGIAVMQLSRYFNNNPLYLEIDMFDDYTEKELYKMIVSRQQVGYNHFYDGLVNSKIAVELEKKSLKSVNDIVNALKHMRIQIIGLRDETFAQVMRGGLSLNEVNESLQLINYPHLYAMGELLDVTGDCGGYNLHFAFCSSYCVAKALERKYYA